MFAKYPLPHQISKLCHSSQTQNIVWRLGVLGIVLILGLTLAIPLSAQGTSSIILSPSTTNVPINQTTALEIRVNNIQDAQGPGLYGADVRLSFDAARIAVQDDSGTQSGVQITPGPLLTSGSYYILFNTADNDAGTIQFVITQFNPTPPVANGNSGVLATIHFEGISTGSASIHFTHAELANRDGFGIPVTTTDGTINVQGATATSTHTLTPSNTPSPTFTQSHTPTNTSTSTFTPSHTPTNTLTRTLTPSHTPTNTPTSTFTPTHTSTPSPTPTWTPTATATLCASKPVKPTLLAPPNGNKIKKRSVALDWSDVPCATFYKVLVRQDSQTGAKADEKNGLAESGYTTKPLAKGKTYYWRASACNAAGCSNSGWWKFTVSPKATFEFLPALDEWQAIWQQLTGRQETTELR